MITQFSRRIARATASGVAPLMVATALVAVATPALSQPSGAYLRVVDVGAGLCVVATTPDGHSMVYDAGRGSERCAQAVRELVPGGRIDLLVLSHSDADHVGATRSILAYADVATIIHPGDPRGPLLTPIRQDILAEGADNWNLQTRVPRPGQVFRVGEATATFVAGWPRGSDTQGPGEPALADEGLHNGLSIVIRFEYRGHAVLLTGDTVGRLISRDDRLCQYAERIMVERAGTVPLRSDVLIGQHHGADNATSNCFIRAVKPLELDRPLSVVFSAGNMYRHPRQSAVDRLVANGVLPQNIFRTDYGGYEGGSGRDREWVTGTFPNCTDEAGDDDVEVRLPSQAGAPVVTTYRTPPTGCSVPVRRRSRR